MTPTVLGVPAENRTEIDDLPAGPDTVATGAFQNGHAMQLIHEELARAQMSARLGEAQTIRRERELARAIRLSRKAEALAQQARLAIARTL